MNPIYIKNYITENYLNNFIEEIKWVNLQERRAECFMADSSKQYQYIENGPIYSSISFHPIIKFIMEKLNEEFNYNLNVCFLNYYLNDRQALGYHADDSVFINQEEPIAVVSFGQERDIWWRLKEDKGNIPDNQKQLLGSGSLFVMPPGFQNLYFHKIPKGSKAMGPRISLTYRSWKE